MTGSNAGSVYRDLFRGIFFFGIFPVGSRSYLYWYGKSGGASDVGQCRAFDKAIGGGRWTGDAGDWYWGAVEVP